MSAATTPGTLHRLAIGTALLAAAAAPLALAVPAEATTSARGCTVRPVRPAFAGTVAGVKQVRYDVAFSCAGNRQIEIQQAFWELDAPPDPDDFNGYAWQSRTFAQPNVALRGVTRPLDDDDLGNAEEIYQNVRFRVSVGGGAFSSWTTYESSPVLTIAN